jgi:hypothetical protein
MAVPPSHPMHDPKTLQSQRSGTCSPGRRGRARFFSRQRTPSPSRPRFSPEAFGAVAVPGQTEPAPERHSRPCPGRPLPLRADKDTQQPRTAMCASLVPDARGTIYLPMETVNHRGWGSAEGWVVDGGAVGVATDPAGSGDSPASICRCSVHVGVTANISARSRYSRILSVRMVLLRSRYCGRALCPDPVPGIQGNRQLARWGS